MKKIIVIMAFLSMLYPIIGLSQTKDEVIDFTKKFDPVIYGVKMGHISQMFAEAELTRCEVYQIDPEQKGKIAVYETAKGEKLLLVSEEYASNKYCVVTYFEIEDKEKSLWIGFESRMQYPKLFKKLDRKLRGAYVKKT